MPGDSLLSDSRRGVLFCGLEPASAARDLINVCAAMVGDSVGSAIGLKTGPKIFSREKSRLFDKEHLLKAQAFYEKHGGKPIIQLASCRSSAPSTPMVASVGKMNYQQVSLLQCHRRRPAQIAEHGAPRLLAHGGHQSRLPASLGQSPVRCAGPHRKGNHRRGAAVDFSSHLYVATEPPGKKKVARRRLRPTVRQLLVPSC